MKNVKKINSTIENKNAVRNFFITRRYEAGLVLLGTEVKSLKLGIASLKDSYVKVNNGELFVKNFKISKYPFAYLDNHEPNRLKKLLLHKHEIKKINIKIIERGFSLIPMKVYFKKGKVKIAIGLGNGKHTYDKKEEIKKRDQKREFARQLKRYL